MDQQEILKKVDHTLLSQTATWEEIKALCDDAVAYQTASVCIPPSYVSQAAGYLGSRMPVCTVIGFPNGYNTTNVKCFETSEAVSNGAAEIDMVVNLGWVKEGRYDLVKEEIRRIKKACDGRLLKVIIETCLLTEEEKKELCRVVTESDAEYIKTSTGFSTHGATFEDVELMRTYTGADKKVKAAGGIADFADAERFVELGADRLGTSRLVKIAKEQGQRENI